VVVKTSTATWIGVAETRGILWFSPCVVRESCCSSSSEASLKTAVIPIRLGSTWVLVRAEYVSEFLPATQWLAVPGASPVVPGVLTWRGRAIPVVDLPRALSLGVLGPLDAKPRIMVVRDAVGCVAIPVDGAREVLPLDDDLLRPQHVASTPYTSRELDTPDSVMPLVEVDQLLRDIGKGAG